MQENRNNRSFKIITVIALCVAVICLSVAYAALSQQLNIQGTATVEKTNWKVIMKNPVETGCKGDGQIEFDRSSISNGVTSITDLVATLTKPGDVAELQLDVVNAGDIDATLESITTNGGKIKCDAAGNLNENDKKVICGGTDGHDPDPGVKVTITYDGEDVTTDDKNVENSDLIHGEEETNKKVLVIRVEYLKTVDAIPTSKVEVTLPDIALHYVQKQEG